MVNIERGRADVFPRWRRGYCHGQKTLKAIKAKVNASAVQRSVSSAGEGGRMRARRACRGYGGVEASDERRGVCGAKAASGGGERAQPARASLRTDERVRASASSPRGLRRRRAERRMLRRMRCEGGVSGGGEVECVRARRASEGCGGVEASDERRDVCRATAARADRVSVQRRGGVSSGEGEHVRARRPAHARATVVRRRAMDASARRAREDGDGVEWSGGRSGVRGGEAA